MVCSSCGRENAPDARFCAACGTALDAHQAEDEVRKVVTVVFTDVAGSTALGERLDPESLRRVMWRYFDEMQAALERHGGTVEKFIGDAVMAVFGVPAVHEDDALRAVRAAFEMRVALERLNAELELEHGVRIATRTGVNTGEVIAGRDGGDQKLATGDAVNVAARLEQAAAPGEVLLGTETYRAVRDAVVVEWHRRWTQRARARSSRPGGCSTSVRTFPPSPVRSSPRSSGADGSSTSFGAPSTRPWPSARARWRPSSARPGSASHGSPASSSIRSGGGARAGRPVRRLRERDRVPPAGRRRPGRRSG